MKQVEEILAEYDAIQNATVIAGYSIMSGTLQPNAGMVFIQLRDWDDRPDAEDHARELVRRLNADFAGRIKEGIAFAFGPPAIPGLGTGSGFTMMLQDRGGNSPEYLFEQSRQFIAGRHRAPGNRQCDHAVPAQFAADISGYRRRQGAEAGRAAGGCQHLRGCLPGGRLCQRLQPLWPSVQGLCPGRTRVPQSIDGINMFLRAQQRGRPVPLSTLVETSDLPARSSPTASTCSARPRLPGSRRPATARRRR